MKTRISLRTSFFITLLFLSLNGMKAQVGVLIHPYISQIFVGACSGMAVFGCTENWYEGEFIELYNPTSIPQNISNWRIEDMTISNNYYTFPANTIMPPNSYLIVASCPSYMLGNYDLRELFPNLYDREDIDIIYQSSFDLSSYLYPPYVDLFLLSSNWSTIDCYRISKDVIAEVRDMNAESAPNNYVWTIWTHYQEEPYPETSIEIDYHPITRCPWTWMKYSEENSNHNIPSNPGGAIGFGTAVGQASQDRNFIYTRTTLSEDGNSYIDQVRYFDGLGRPEQTVQKKITPSGYDLVTMQEYDALGRESNSWLPVHLSGNNGAYVSPDTYKDRAKNTIHKDNIPFSKPVYEPSPLNRIVEQYGPGKAWHNNNKSIRTEYLTNVDNTGNVLSCIYYAASNSSTTPTLSKSNNYASNELFVTKFIDEDDNEMYEFKNKLGQVVLTRQMDDTAQHDTYYVYDDFGNLVFVLPPLAADGLSGTTFTVAGSDILKHYVYVYAYDERNRCIEKKLPGVEPVYYEYDQADRLILSQDGEQRADDFYLYTFTIPDVFGRIVLQGTCEVHSMGGYVKASYEGESATGYFSSYGYTVTGLSDLSHIKVSQVFYYDNYNFKDEVTGFGSSYNYSTTDGFGDKRYDVNNDGIKSKGLLTGTLTELFDNLGTRLASVFYYDKKGNLIYSVSGNHLDGFEKEYTKYSFTGLPTEKKTIHTTGNNSGYPYKTSNPLVQNYTYEYDHAGRLVEIKYKVMNDKSISLSKLDYNELGQLEKKMIHNYRDTVTYTYNIRNWVKEIYSDVFSQTLYYNESYQSNTPRYNGNISAMDYQMQAYTGTSTFYYSYDGLNRLKKSEYSHQGTSYPAGGSFNEEMEYDKMGNIKTLKRWDCHPLATNGGILIDNLAITHNGNRLWTVADAADRNAGFVASNNIPAPHYVYDYNGRMVDDKNKGMSITYNRLGLPERIFFGGNNAIDYLYDGAGIKRGVTHTTQRHTTGGENTGMGGSGVPPAPLITQTDYCGAVIYEDWQLKQILTPEGYLSTGGSGTQSFRYNYFVNDYLGNVRAVLTYSTGNAYTITQQNDYYAWGLPTSTSVNPEAQPYKREGKELDEMHGLNTYDQGARQFGTYLPVTMAPDPLAEKYYSISPYAQHANNPVLFVDPTGCYVESGSMGKWLTNMAALMKTLANLNNNNQDGINDSRISGIESLISTMNNMLFDKEDTFSLKRISGYEGGLTYNNETGIITISYFSTSNFVHETAHVGQYFAGGIGFAKDSGNAVANDIYDEAEAYRSQYLFDPSSLPMVTDVSEITPTWVLQIVNNEGIQPYTQRSYNVGLYPLDKNSGMHDAYIALRGRYGIIPVITPIWPINKFAYLLGKTYKDIPNYKFR